MNDKEKSYLKLVRDPPPAIDEPEENYDAELEHLKGLSFKERLRWRGIETKAVMLGFAAISIMISSIVLLSLAAWLSTIN